MSSTDKKWTRKLGHLLITEGARYRDASSSLAHRDAADDQLQSAAQSLKSYGDFLLKQGNSCIRSTKNNSGLFSADSDENTPYHAVAAATWLGTEAQTWAARANVIGRKHKVREALLEYGEFLLRAAGKLLELA